MASDPSAPAAELSGRVVSRLLRPTRADLAAAAGRTIPDLVGPDLRVLFAGINPSLYSAATGHHFARPGNRFWPALHRSGFTARQLHPSEQSVLPALGMGVTNVVARATARGDELSCVAFLLQCGEAASAAQPNSSKAARSWPLSRRGGGRGSWPCWA